jgi:hypothetical protein
LPIGHTLGAGGPEIEFLILAGACLVLGVFFFFQKNVKPQASVVLLVVAIALGVGAFAIDGDSSSDSSAEGESIGSSPVVVTIDEPEDGATVPAGEELLLEVELEGGELVDGSTGTDPTKGHLHIYVDGALTTMPSVESPPIAGDLLDEGEHEITVEFTRADHRSFDPRVTTVITVVAE